MLYFWSKNCYSEYLMNPQEILPQPERAQNPQFPEVSVGENETTASRMVENKQGPGVGASAVSGVAVGQAQNQIGTIPAAQSPHLFGQSQQQSSAVVLPAIADDLDLIEKEWVIKAKAIVAATVGDPHRQTIEINKMKADYMRKRYNRDIKVGGK